MREERDRRHSFRDWKRRNSGRKRIGYELCEDVADMHPNWRNAFDAHYLITEGENWSYSDSAPLFYDLYLNTSKNAVRFGILYGINSRIPYNFCDNVRFSFYLHDFLPVISNYIEASYLKINKEKHGKINHSKYITQEDNQGYLLCYWVEIYQVFEFFSSSLLFSRFRRGSGKDFEFTGSPPTWVDGLWKSHPDPASDCTAFHCLDCFTNR